MDCLFNKTIPKSTTSKFIFQPKSKTFITGDAMFYNIYYPKELIPYIDEKKFINIMENLMDLMYMTWPCCLCTNVGYLCCLCTIGFSFLFAGCTIRKAKKILFEQIKEVNDTDFIPRSLILKYKNNCLTSWFEVEIILNYNSELVLKNSNNESSKIKDTI